MPLYLPYQSWSEAVPVYFKGTLIGKATSGTWSPMLKKYIAIARIKPEYASPGKQVEMEVTVDFERHNAKAQVGKNAFLQSPSKNELGKLKDEKAYWHHWRGFCWPGSRT